MMLLLALKLILITGTDPEFGSGVHLVEKVEDQKTRGKGAVVGEVALLYQKSSFTGINYTDCDCFMTDCFIRVPNRGGYVCPLWIHHCIILM